MFVHSFERGSENKISDFFREVFEKSEGPDEGLLIGSLASEIFRSTEPYDFYCDVITENDQIIASAFYTRLTYPSGVNTFVIGPVAVHHDFQRRGIGQKLLKTGITSKIKTGMDYILTYGDPAFYGKVGFVQISEDDVKAPFRLSLPEGWLLYHHSADYRSELAGNPNCVQALNDVRYW